MARGRPLSPQLRRRRLVASTLFAVAVVAAASVAVVAVRGGGGATAPTLTTPARSRPFRIVFPEGFTRLQMAEQVAAVAKIADREHRSAPVALNEQAYLAASQEAVVPCFGRKPRHDLEGFLFPATYDFLAGTTARELVRAQITAFCQRWKRVNLSGARTKSLTPYDVLEIASMIEREVAVPAERPLVSAVIYNRLRDGMQLGIDATLRYGLHIPPTQSITEAELASSNPYNSRRFYGLPPTPIANPGLPSIEAAAHPAHVDYLYFVRKPDRRHDFFTASEDAFDRYLATHGYK